MNYSQLDLELFKIFGRKELSFGCVLNNFGEIIKLKKDYKIIQNNESEKDIFIFGKNEDELSLNHKTEILGHEPTITDVFRVAEEKRIFLLVQTNDFTNYYIGLASENLKYREIPYNPTLPLLQQTDETKQQLIDLFQSQ